MSDSISDPGQPRYGRVPFLRWYLAVSSAALIALITVVTILMLNNQANTRDLQRVAAAQQASDITQCRLQNVTRVQDIAIWNRLLYVPPTAAKAETAAQKAEIAELERLVKAKDTPRNCAAAYPGR